MLGPVLRFLIFNPSKHVIILHINVIKCQYFNSNFKPRNVVITYVDER